MKMWIERIGRDRIGAIMTVSLGVAVLIAGVGYKIDTLNRMGAGFIPVVLGVLLCLIGLAIWFTADVGRAGTPTASTGHGHHPSQPPEWRGWGCILGGVVAFVVLGEYGGLVPASFFSVFISALGDRQSTIKRSAVLALVLTVFGIGIFHFALHLQLPLFHWGG